MDTLSPYISITTIDAQSHGYGHFELSNGPVFCSVGRTKSFTCKVLFWLCCGSKLPGSTSQWPSGSHRKAKAAKEKEKKRAKFDAEYELKML